MQQLSPGQYETLIALLSAQSQLSVLDTMNQQPNAIISSFSGKTFSATLHFQSKVPLTYWGDLVFTATYLINCTHAPILQNKTPCELLFHKPPLYDTGVWLPSICFYTS